MYFTDISNPELQQFHNLKAHNFTIKLTDALDSPLFKVEEITNSIYKVYPLFYTGEINSTNPDDKIFENKLIICNKTEKETFLSFISDDGEVTEYTEYGTYYDIGDSLTTEQFNAFVSLLRKSVTHNESIRINDMVLGVYGTYEFDITDSMVVDTGIVVSDETITAQPTITLTNPVYKTSNYYLTLKMLHNTSLNILDDLNRDFRVVDEITLTLKENEPVNIPVETLEKGDIISLDCEIIIKHDKTIIQQM